MARKSYYVPPDDVPDAIRKTRKHIQHMLHNPPATRGRLLTAYKEAIKALDTVLQLAEISAEQKHKDTFPDEFHAGLEKSQDALRMISDDDPNIETIREAVQMMIDFAEIDVNRVPPEFLRRDICAALKIK